jgi:hypothetical protein
MADKVRLCEVCRVEIPAERLEAVPETWLCRSCAGRIDKYGGEFKLTARQESLGKQGSLKKNYGGVSVRRTRNMAALEKLRAEYESRLQDEASV